MTGEEFEKLIKERGEFVLINYLPEYNLFTYSWKELTQENMWLHIARINACKNALDHKSSSGCYPQFDNDFIYIINKTAIPVPLTPLLLHIANDAAHIQKRCAQMKTAGQL